MSVRTKYRQEVFYNFVEEKRRERCGGGEMERERKSGGRVGWF